MHYCTLCNDCYCTFSVEFVQIIQSVPLYPLQTCGYRTVVLDRAIASQISPDAQNNSFDRSIDLNWISFDSILRGVGLNLFDSNARASKVWILSNSIARVAVSNLCVDWSRTSVGFMLSTHSTHKDNSIEHQGWSSTHSHLVKVPRKVLFLVTCNLISTTNQNSMVDSRSILTNPSELICTSLAPYWFTRFPCDPPFPLFVIPLSIHITFWFCH